MWTLLALFASAFAAPASIARCSDTVPALPDGMADVAKRVVRIETALGTGSGAVVSPDGFVLTAAHVLSGATKARVVFPDESSMDAEVVRSNRASDLALLRLPKTGMPCLKVAAARQAAAADVYVVGSPGGKALTGSVTKGIVSSYRDHEGWVTLQTDASMNAGNSGGPVLGKAGDVAAIVSFKVAGLGVEGIGFAVAVEELARALDVQFGDKTDAEVKVVMGEGERKTFEPPPPTFERAPASPGAPPRGDVCAEFDVKSDPFDGARTVHARAADLFSLDWKSGEKPTFTAFLPLSSARGLAWDGDAYEGGALTLDILLENDTRIHLVSAEADIRRSGVMPVLASRFVIDKAVAEAIAGSGPTYLRWTVPDLAPVDQDRSARQRERYYRPAFACLAKNLP